MRRSGRRSAVNPESLGNDTSNAPQASRPDRRGDVRTRTRRPGPVGAVTAPSTRSPGGDLPVESLVTATERARWSHGLGAEHRAIVELARRPVSFVEIGAVLTVPAPRVRGLVDELVDRGFLAVHAPPPAFAAGGPPPIVLTRLLRGLRRR